VPNRLVFSAGGYLGTTMTSANTNVMITANEQLPDILIHSFYQNNEAATGWCTGTYLSNVSSASKTLTMNDKAKYSTKCTWHLDSSPAGASANLTKGPQFMVQSASNLDFFVHWLEFVDVSQLPSEALLENAASYNSNADPLKLGVYGSSATTTDIKDTYSLNPIPTTAEITASTPLLGADIVGGTAKAAFAKLENGANCVTAAVGTNACIATE